MISVVIPTFNAAPHLVRALPPLVPAVADGLVRELIVSDGGSTDATLAIAEDVGARVVTGGGTRAARLNAGAAVARSDWLLFLHAETTLDDDWARDAAHFMAQPASRERAAVFRFDVSDAGARHAVWWTRLRSAAGWPVGAQGLLMARAFHDALGGYREDAAAEDIDLARRIGGRRFTHLPSRAMVSR